MRRRVVMAIRSRPLRCPSASVTEMAPAWSGSSEWLRLLEWMDQHHHVKFFSENKTQRGATGAWTVGRGRRATRSNRERGPSLVCISVRSIRRAPVWCVGDERTMGEARRKRSARRRRSSTASSSRAQMDEQKQRRETTRTKVRTGEKGLKSRKQTARRQFPPSTPLSKR